MTLPKELWLTFEDGLHVGVFHDREGAERLNDLRRKKRGVKPVIARYLLQPQPYGIQCDSTTSPLLRPELIFRCELMAGHDGLHSAINPHTGSLWQWSKTP